MASDSLNQVGKYISKSRQDANFALTRYGRNRDRIERSRDVFDYLIPFEMEFEVNSGDRVTMDVNFLPPPPMRGCRSRCITSTCELFSIPGGLHYVNLQHNYLTGTVLVYVNSVQTTDFVLRPLNSIYVNGLLDGVNTVVICYTYWTEGREYIDRSTATTGQISAPPTLDTYWPGDTRIRWASRSITGLVTTQGPSYYTALEFTGWASGNLTVQVSILGITVGSSVSSRYELRKNGGLLYSHDQTNTGGPFISWTHPWIQTYTGEEFDKGDILELYFYLTSGTVSSIGHSAGTVPQYIQHSGMAGGICDL